MDRAGVVEIIHGYRASGGIVGEVTDFGSVICRSLGDDAANIDPRNDENIAETNRTTSKTRQDLIGLLLLTSLRSTRIKSQRVSRDEVAWSVLMLN